MTNPVHAQDPAAADAPAASASTAPARPAIVIDAERNFYDLRSGVTRFEENVSITRGAMEVQADLGTIRQAEGQITEVELEGSPSTWRDRLEDGSIVTGEASMIHFDVIANVVTLTGNAIIRHEQGEFTGDELVYDLTAESLAGRSTGDERVRVVIEPEAMSSPVTPPPADANAGDEASEPPSTEASTEAAIEAPSAEPPATDGEATTEPPGAAQASDDEAAAGGDAEAGVNEASGDNAEDSGDDEPDDGPDGFGMARTTP